ncbi:MAG: CRISPR-associated endonuclease Cas1 [Bacteroidota bacterium]|nr:CRISPR-associated endonuclease Cas1 [Bacteroidota bacterium]MDE2646504.1 CRISPR-associated endonuclease Cas1 [Bacteroidota bacterium]MXW14358.1 CRISPR-associated endonuclease Cas1 [Rhodothermaceae bacterium]MYC04915.1 CRISPR-associated endonuclease Cas1 [Rhodothermaceae bacterium]MYI37171.1 CRISPR-associated endonuclease Cas1 [Acidimicrobiaceae bacterium]
MDNETPQSKQHSAVPSGFRSPLVPARMVNAWVYCPRLAYLEWVEGEWAESADVAEGNRAHARVDRGSGHLPKPDELDEIMAKARSVTMSSERLGVIAKLDVIEVANNVVRPVDFKKGKRPHVVAGAYEPERVQVCVQAMILEDNGYSVDHGALWYVGSREKVRVILDEELRATTIQAIKELRDAEASRQRPPPLEDSPKCPRCSLAGICLPDETNLFRTGTSPRPLHPSDDTALPLYVQEPGARLRKSGARLIVQTKRSTVEVPMISVSQVVLYGPVSVTTPALHALMRAKIPVSWYSTSGWFLGHTIGTGNGNVAVREAQYRTAFDSDRSLRFAKSLVQAKVKNSRTMLRRNWRKEHSTANKEDVLVKLKRITKRIPYATDLQQLLGLEGEAAATYFGEFNNMLTKNASGDIRSFSFATRNRRPPTDPVNAMLSLAYALLVRLFSTTITSVGLDPYLGLYHRPRHNRPALALDLMEPFRSIIADSCVIQIVNNGEIRPNDFIFIGRACSLKPAGRKALIAAFERRLEHVTTHPFFGYRVSMRRLIEVQCRLLARHFQGEIAEYPHYLPR